MLSPFDNLIADRARAELLFDLPTGWRSTSPRRSAEYGYYTMPVLDGERFVARVDPAIDRATKVVVTRARGARETASAEGSARSGGRCGDLAGWLGATGIDRGSRADGVPHALR